MTIVESHALSVAVEERRAELRRYVEWCESNRPSWTDLVSEYRVRLDELDRLALSAQVASMTHEQEAVYASLRSEDAYFRAHEDMPEGEARADWGNR